VIFAADPEGSSDTICVPPARRPFPRSTSHRNSQLEIVLLEKLSTFASACRKGRPRTHDDEDNAFTAQRAEFAMFPILLSSPVVQHIPHRRNTGPVRGKGELPGRFPNTRSSKPEQP